MKDLLFLASDLWLMATCWYLGNKIYRAYHTHLLTLESFFLYPSAVEALTPSTRSRGPSASR